MVSTCWWRSPPRPSCRLRCLTRRCATSRVRSSPSPMRATASSANTSCNCCKSRKAASRRRPASPNAIAPSFTSCSAVTISNRACSRKKRPCPERGVAASRSVFARRDEVDPRPALHGQVEIDARRREIGEVPGIVQGESVVGLAAELLEALRIVANHPTRGCDRHRLEQALHAVFVLQPLRDHVEMQPAHCAQYLIIAVERAEQLRRPLL